MDPCYLPNQPQMDPCCLPNQPQTQPPPTMTPCRPTPPCPPPQTYQEPKPQPQVQPTAPCPPCHPPCPPEGGEAVKKDEDKHDHQCPDAKLIPRCDYEKITAGEVAMNIAIVVLVLVLGTVVICMLFFLYYNPDGKVMKVRSEEFERKLPEEDDVVEELVRCRVGQLKD